MSSNTTTLKDRRGRKYTPAVGPKLRPWLWIVLGGFALLGANGVYLASVTAISGILGDPQQTYFYFLMVIMHLALGLGLILPFIIFGMTHLVTSWNRPNKAAIRYGLVLLAASFVILISGLILVRFSGFEIALTSRFSLKVPSIEVRDPNVRNVGYWLHVIIPLVAIGLYIKHRLAGPQIRWVWAKRWGVVVAVVVAIMGALHSQDPRQYTIRGPKEGISYFRPSEAITANGKYIPADTMMMDNYCLKCHKDSYDSWFHSAHHFSSFNNKAYLSSVRETRQIAMERDGNTKAARWCAGCHDPVPFFSGEFDDPNYDDVNTPSSQAGITCTACHSITNVNSTRGNADYTIEEPTHYPFAKSNNALLQWINTTLVKAKPEMHKKTFLKPAIKDSKFCSTCHKVGLPFALNHYKDFLRGQNHYDTYLLSGVSGHGARSFYYPPMAKGKCVDCHMNLIPSNDFGARDFDGQGGREIHNHLFLGANTGLATLRGREDIAAIHAKYLSDQKVRVDLFALREGGTVEGKLLGPLRPEIPTLQPGGKYLVETVVRTLAIGHPFSQGTVDSNEIWVELIVRQGDTIIGRSGGIGEDGTVDPYSHFINVYMLDRDGKRVDRRNPQDIFVPLYNKQIPPGAGQVVHFGLELDPEAKGPITLEAKVNYRKFDRKYFDYIYGVNKGPKLPVTVMASDKVILPVEGGGHVTNEPSPIKETWQRWNDYGIGLFLEGSDKGGQKGELKQAEPIFQKVAELGKADGWVNLARVYQREGRIPDARAALAEATAAKEPAAPWVIAWLTGQINERNGFLDEAITSYESVLATKIPTRGFDFSSDYEVLNSLANAVYGRARQELIGSTERMTLLQKTVATYRKTIAIDSENVVAHYGLGLAYDELARTETDLKENHSEAGSNGGAETLTYLVGLIVDPVRNASDRAEQSRNLDWAVNAFLKAPRPADASRLNPLHDIVAKLGQIYESEQVDWVKPALAKTLATTHKALHSMFKPDETAEGRAVAIARRDNPAADMYSQSIVIHPLHRLGAPGMGTTAHNHPPAAKTEGQE